MNAAFVLVTAALLSGSHPGGASCSSCGTTTTASCDSCNGHGHGHGRGCCLFGGCHKSSSCESCAPAPACNTCESSCNGHGHGCHGGGCGFFSRLRGLFHHNNHSDCACETSCCGTAAPAASGTPSTAPSGSGDAPSGTTDSGTTTDPGAGNPPAGETIQEAPRRLPGEPQGDRLQSRRAAPAPLAIPTATPVNQTRPAPVAIPSSVRNPF